MNWMRTTPVCQALGLGVLLCWHVQGHAKVVINEIFYHAPNGIEDLQWIELHNTAPNPVDISGWSFSKGVRFTVPAGTSIPANGFWVVARNAKRFQQFYRTSPNGEFERTLKRKGERVELSDANGKTVESLKFDDHTPWPSAPDGLTASLERICPDAPASLPENWASSTLASNPDLPSGTPGKLNSAFSANLPPVVHHLTYTPAVPVENQGIAVDVQVEDTDGLGPVSLVYAVYEPGKPPKEARVAMAAGAGQHFQGEIPGQPAGRLIRFWIEAEDRQGTKRRYPGANEPRPTYSAWVPARELPTKLSLARLIHLDPTEYARGQRDGGGPDMSMQLRWNIQSIVLSQLDLESLWCGLVLTLDATVADSAALAPVFQTFQEERERLIKELTSAADLSAALQSSGQKCLDQKAALQTALASRLNTAQRAALQSWINGLPIQAALAATPPSANRRRGEMMLKQVFRMEPGFAAVTRRTGLNDATLQFLRDTYRKMSERRLELVDVAASVRDADSYQSLMEKVQGVSEALEAELKKSPVSDTGTVYAEALEAERSARSFNAGRSGGGAAGVIQGKSAMIWYEAGSKEPRLFDYVSIANRKAGYKVRLPKDRPLNGMSAINLIFEDNPRMVLAEPLALELYRMVGMPASLTDFTRVVLDDAPLGYQLLIEQPNAAFLRRNGLPENGDVFKFLWFENGIARQHEKKNNPHRGHEDLVELIQQLGKLSGADQWLFIKKQFDVEEVINYFAVNMLLSHWDGFMNNFFAYHDYANTGRWILFPWDQDKTWGLYDGLGADEVFTTLPLRFGSAGDVPPGWNKPQPPRTFFETMNTRGSEWWRPPGYFSGPLLSNPVFRANFVARIKELLETDFTEDRLLPKFDALKARLREEVRYRAKLRGEDEAEAVAGFERDIDSFRRFVKGRREFLLAQPELKSAGAFDRTQLK